MKMKTTDIVSEKNILANDHYVTQSYDCSSLTPNSDGIIPAGTIVPANDATAIGVLLSDVVPADNPNGTIVIHGFIDNTKLPEAPSSVAISAAAMRQITFLPVTEVSSSESESDSTDDENMGGTTSDTTGEENNGDTTDENTGDNPA